MVDVVGDPGQQIPERIVRGLGEMHDGIDAFEVACRQPPDVLPDLFEPGYVRFEKRCLIEARVDTDHVVAAVREDRRQQTRDVPSVPVARTFTARTLDRSIGHTAVVDGPEHKGDVSSGFKS